jgi:hypothetical protein
MARATIRRPNPGDDNDTVEGGEGYDTLLFNGANVGETVYISANGGRASMTRDIATVTMDLDDLEHIDFVALGGADIVTIDDLGATDVEKVTVRLGSFGGAGDAQIDTVNLRGTSGDDSLVVAGDATVVSVAGFVRRGRHHERRSNRQAGITTGAATMSSTAGPRARGDAPADAGEGDDTLVAARAMTFFLATATMCSSAGPATISSTAGQATTC